MSEYEDNEKKCVLDWLRTISPKAGENVIETVKNRLVVVHHR